MTSYSAPGSIGATLISEQQLATRVAELGAQISLDYADKTPLVIAVLKGSAIFVADLVRSIDVPLAMDFLEVSSYGDQTISTGVVKIVKDLDQNVAGRDVLLIEDIVDSGRTLQRLVEYIGDRKPASLKTCALLLRDDQDTDSPATAKVEYFGFKIPSSAFVIGYGLDAAQIYRNLRYIAEYEAA